MTAIGATGAQVDFDDHLPCTLFVKQARPGLSKELRMPIDDDLRLAAVRTRERLLVPVAAVGPGTANAYVGFAYWWMATDVGLVCGAVVKREVLEDVFAGKLDGVDTALTALVYDDPETGGKRGAPSDVTLVILFNLETMAEVDPPPPDLPISRLAAEVPAIPDRLTRKRSVRLRRLGNRARRHYVRAVRGPAPRGTYGSLPLPMGVRAWAGAWVTELAACGTPSAVAWARHWSRR